MGCVDGILSASVDINKRFSSVLKSTVVLELRPWSLRLVCLGFSPGLVTEKLYDFGKINLTMAQIFHL